MSKILLLILILFTVTNCNIKKVVDHHGVPFLEKKQNSLTVDRSNKNDIQKILGLPSTKSKFDKDIWIYVERVIIQSEIKNLGKEKIYKNNVLVLKIDNLGILKEKKLYNINDFEELDISKDATKNICGSNSFIYNFMSSMRQKINDPLGQRAKKRKEISQR